MADMSKSRDLARLRRRLKPLMPKAFEVVEAWIHNGSFKAATWAIDRYYGKPSQSLHVTGPEGAPLVITPARLRELDTTELLAVYQLMEKVKYADDKSGRSADGTETGDVDGNGPLPQ